METWNADSILPDTATRRANAAHYDPRKHADQCYICERGLTEKAAENGWMIHLSTDGGLFHRDDEAAWTSPKTQGAFPVGSECAKKIPTAYRFRAGGAH